MASDLKTGGQTVAMSTEFRLLVENAARHDRMILACFVLGLSTRKVATALAPVLGRRISAAQSVTRRNQQEAGDAPVKLPTARACP